MGLGVASMVSYWISYFSFLVELIYWAQLKLKLNMGGESEKEGSYNNDEVVDWRDIEWRLTSGRD